MTVLLNKSKLQLTWTLRSHRTYVNKHIHIININLTTPTSINKSQLNLKLKWTSKHQPKVNLIQFALIEYLLIIPKSSTGNMIWFAILQSSKFNPESLSAPKTNHLSFNFIRNYYYNSVGNKHHIFMNSYNVAQFYKIN